MSSLLSITKPAESTTKEIKHSTVSHPNLRRAGIVIFCAGFGFSQFVNHYSTQAELKTEPVVSSVATTTTVVTLQATDPKASAPK